ncbi:hypothetical protein JX265_011722 [Neoarthrinium moseri]|uniref:NACHT domain-containing protein n=1 Tax=Neoarthrinium moseri TaxID=1658444 RepID=A0A9P9WBF1_9PEZI|nr:hypothetical protein JX265_011722 [Neoarthrinium moseri]
MKPRRRLQHDNYTVAILCPMAVELTPVIDLFDEHHENLSLSRDQNAYSLGKMGQHNVVVTTVWKISTIPASIAITQLLNDFGKIRFVLLVGVAGGIPYEAGNRDIRLGDVVVSEARGRFGGVVQLDLGKSTEDGFVRTGHLDSVPRALASNVEQLKAYLSSAENLISRHLNELLRKYPNKKKEYCHPGPEFDHLFKASYHHTGGETCGNCDTAQTIRRRQRNRLGPKIHYGTIGSSNAVVETVKTRHQLQDQEILCVEMEAAGVMEAFPCLVIRGISDYADSHKNKDWQAYAAATAAAYTKELLLRIPPVSVKHTQDITDKKEIKILEWLSPKDTNFSLLQNLSQQTRTPGTGQWLLKDARYRQWRDSTPGLLWLYGAVGCGKTILCSTIINNLQLHARLNPTKNVAYWYFRFDNSDSQDLSKMLRSIIRQLSCSPLPVELRELHDRHSRAGSDPSLDDLKATLTQILRIDDRNTYIVFDALDECSHADNWRQRHQLLGYVKELVSKLPKLHLLVTSRPEPDIIRELGNIANRPLDIEELINEDVRKHVEEALNKHLRVDRQVKDRVGAKLLSQRETRFRWAALQLDRFIQCTSMAELEMAFQTIPETLEASYEQTFEKIKDRHRECVRRIMMWLAVSYQPLSVNQVASIVGLIQPGFVVKICTTQLVTILDANATTQFVKLAHFSVKEFLIKKLGEEVHIPWYQFSSELANQHVAVTAIEALLEPQSHLNLIHWYAAKYWPQHATEGLLVEERSKLEDRINRLFHPKNEKEFQGWLNAHDPDKTRHSQNSNMGGSLYYAALLGFDKVVHGLWANESQLYGSQGTHGNALNAAAVCGNVEIVRWILKRCQNPAKFINLVAIAKLIRLNGKEIIEELCMQVPGLRVSAAVIEAAAGNQLCGQDLMELFLKKGGDQAPITEDAVMAAAGNEEHGLRIMELMLRERRNQVVLTAYVVKAAAGNADSGEELIEMLLQEKGDQLHITEDVLMAAIQNTYYGYLVMGVLLKKRGGEFNITEEVAIAAAENIYCGREVMDMLLEVKGDDFDITEDVLIAAAENTVCGQEVMEILLGVEGKYFDITENVLIAADNEGRGDQGMMEMLLEKKRGQICTPEDVDMTDAEDLQIIAGDDGSFRRGHFMGGVSYRPQANTDGLF